jgi:hypothetical protein
MMQELPDVSLREIKQDTNCKLCNHVIQDKFCGHCGQPVVLKRVDGHYVLHEIQHVLHLERGIFYTIQELLQRPGKTVREFIADNRNRLVKPILFIILTSLIYTLIQKLFHIEAAQIPAQEPQLAAIGLIFAWIQHYYGYANILMGVFIALWLRLFFRKQDYNFFEILILLCFVIGIGMLIAAVFVVAEGVTKLHFTRIFEIVSISYCTWAIGSFFNAGRVSSYVKALVAYLLGMISFGIAAVLLGILIALFILH